MTRQRDIGRVLDAWLAPGPTEAPDRILDVLADRIELVPQRRYPRAHERFHAMTPPVLKLAAAAAILLAIGLAAGPLVTTAPNVASSPSPAGSAPPTSTAVPEALRYRWFTGSGADPDAPAAEYRLLTIDDDSLSIIGGSGFQLGDRLSSSGPGQLRTSSLAGGTTCVGAEAGTYAWSLSPGETKLSLRADVDPCAERVARLTGEFLRIDCRNPDDPCIGSLEAGTYYSNEFSPGRFPGGFVRYTVPQGWANASDGPSGYSLVPADLYRSGAVDAGQAPSIEVFSRPAAASQDERCPWTEEPGVGTAMAELVDWITSHPAVVVEGQEQITIDGHDGVVLDLALAPSWTRTCPELGVTDPVAVLLTEAGARDDYLWGIGTGGDGSPGRNRVILLDLGGGYVVHIWLGTPNASDLDAFVAQAMPIVESMHFVSP